MTVLDIGAGQNPDPRATETVDLHVDADHQFDLDEEWPLDDNYALGITAHHVIEHLDPHHVMREASRVLQPGGWLKITVPLGIAQRTDPTHEWYPTVESAEVLAGGFHEDRHWDPDVPLTLDGVTLDVGFLGPLTPLSPLLQACTYRWPVWAADKADRGEMRLHYRREHDD